MKDHADCLDEYKEIADIESRNRERWREDLMFGWASDQWPEKLKRIREQDPHGMRPCLTINKIPAHARQIINDMRQARASIKVLPVDDQADIDAAEVFQGIIRHIEHVSSADQAYSIATEYQVMMGVGYFRIKSDTVDHIYNEQDLRIVSVRNPFSVYLDPWHQDITGADASTCFITSRYSHKAFKAKWKKAEMVSVESRSEDNQWFTDKEVQIAEHYWIVEEPEKHLVLMDRRVVLAAEYDPSLGPYEREVEINRKRLKWALLTGADILEEQDLPGQYIPIVRVAGEDIEIDGERVVHGIVRRARDAQLMYNYTASVIAERNALEPKAPWLASNEALEGYEDDYANANRSNVPFLRYNALDDNGNPLQPPQRQFSNSINPGLTQQLMASDGDIQSTIGQFAASLGQPSNEKSGIAIRQRQQVGDIATYHYPDNLSRAIRQCGRILIDLIPTYYDTPRVARILGEDGEASSVQIDPSIPTAMQDNGKKAGKIYNLGVGKYDVAVDIGPSYNTKRQEAFDAMAQMTQGNPQLWSVIGDLLVKNMDWPGAQEMAKRLKATIPPEIRQEEEEADIPPEAAQAIQQAQIALDEQGQQLEMLAQQNQEMQSTIDGKVLEQEMKAQEHQMKMAEMEQEFALKQMEYSYKTQELQFKQQDSATTHAMVAESNIMEAAQMTEMVQIAAQSSAETQQILLALAQATQQHGDMLAAMLQEMGKPKVLSVETDANGNVVGGVSRTLN